MKFIKILIFSFIRIFSLVCFSNYYNNYLKNRFLRNYEPMVETVGHVSFFFLLKNNL